MIKTQGLKTVIHKPMIEVRTAVFTFYIWPMVLSNSVPNLPIAKGVFHGAFRESLNLMIRESEQVVTVSKKQKAFI